MKKKRDFFLSRLLAATLSFLCLLPPPSEISANTGLQLRNQNLASFFDLTRLTGLSIEEFVNGEVDYYRWNLEENWEEKVASLKQILYERLRRLESGADYVSEDKKAIEKMEQLGFKHFNTAFHALLLKTKVRPNRFREEQLEDDIRRGDYLSVARYFFDSYRYPNEEWQLNYMWPVMQGMKYRGILSGEMYYQEYVSTPEKVIHEIKKDTLTFLQELREFAREGTTSDSWNAVQKKAVSDVQRFLDSHFETVYGFKFPLSLEQAVVFWKKNHSFNELGKVSINYDSAAEKASSPDDLAAVLGGAILHEVLHLVLPYSICNFFSLIDLDEGFISSEAAKLVALGNQNGFHFNTKAQDGYAPNIEFYEKFERLIGRESMLEMCLRGSLAGMKQAFGRYGNEVLALLEYVQSTSTHAAYGGKGLERSEDVLQKAVSAEALLAFVEQEELTMSGKVGWEERIKTGTVFAQEFKEKLKKTSNKIAPFHHQFEQYMTEETKRRREVLKRIGPEVEKFAQEQFEAPVKIVIVPAGSTLRGYAGTESDLEFSIYIIDGLETPGVDLPREWRETVRDIYKEAVRLIGDAFEVDEVIPLEGDIYNLTGLSNKSPGDLRGVKEYLMGQENWLPRTALVNLLLPAMYGDDEAVNQALSVMLEWLWQTKDNGGRDIWNMLRENYLRALRPSSVLQNKQRPHLEAWLRERGILFPKVKTTVDMAELRAYEEGIEKLLETFQLPELKVMYQRLSTQKEELHLAGNWIREGVSAFRDVAVYLAA